MEQGTQHPITLRSIRKFLIALVFGQIVIPLVDLLFNDYWDLIAIDELPLALSASGLLYFFCVLLSIFFLINPARLYPFFDRIENIYHSKKQMYIVFNLLALIFLTTVVVIYVFEQPLPRASGLRYLYFGYGYFHNFFYLLSYISLAAIIFLIAWIHSRNKTDRNVQARVDELNLIDRAVITILLAVIFAVSLFLFLTVILLVFRIPFNHVINFWYFDLRKNIPPIMPLRMVLVVGAITFFLITFVYRNERGKFGWLLFVGVALQFLFPLLQDGTLNRLAYRQDHTGAGAYIQTVCQYPEVGDFYKDYEEIMGSNHWLATKPPGYLAPYYWGKSLVQLVVPSIASSSESCRKIVSNVFAYVFPLLSIGSMGLLYQVSKNYYSKSKRTLVVLILILMPNFILFTGMVDQFLLPVLFMFLVLISIKMTQTASIKYAIAAGLWYYLCVSYSFSLIGILGFPWIMLGLKFLSKPSPQAFKKIALLVATTIVTVLFCELIIQWLTDYNTLEGIQQSLEVHRSLIRIKPSDNQFWNSVLINNLEYLFWVGPPVVILVCVGLLSKAGRINYKSEKAILINASILFYVLLNLSGQNRAETSRLWLFLNPLLALIAPIYIVEMDAKTQKRLITGLIIAQLCLMYLANQPFYELFRDGIIKK